MRAALVLLAFWGLVAACANDPSKDDLAPTSRVSAVDPVGYSGAVTSVLSLQGKDKDNTRRLHQLAAPLMSGASSSADSSVLDHVSVHAGAPSADGQQYITSRSLLHSDASPSNWAVTTHPKRATADSVRAWVAELAAMTPEQLASVLRSIGLNVSRAAITMIDGVSTGQSLYPVTDSTPSAIATGVSSSRHLSGDTGSVTSKQDGKVDILAVDDLTGRVNHSMNSNSGRNLLWGGWGGRRGGRGGYNGGGGSAAASSSAAAAGNSAAAAAAAAAASGRGRHLLDWGWGHHDNYHGHGGYSGWGGWHGNHRGGDYGGNSASAAAAAAAASGRGRHLLDWGWGHRDSHHGHDSRHGWGGWYGGRHGGDRHGNSAAAAAAAAASGHGRHLLEGAAHAENYHGRENWGHYDDNAAAEKAKAEDAFIASGGGRRLLNWGWNHHNSHHGHDHRGHNDGDSAAAAAAAAASGRGRHLLDWGWGHHDSHHDHHDRDYHHNDRHGWGGWYGGWGGHHSHDHDGNHHGRRLLDWGWGHRDSHHDGDYHHNDRHGWGGWYHGWGGHHGHDHDGNHHVRRLLLDWGWGNCDDVDAPNDSPYCNGWAPWLGMWGKSEDDSSAAAAPAAAATGGT